MPAKKKSKRRTAAAKKRSRGARKPARRRRATPAKSKIRKTAVKVLAGAAAGAVRAIIPPLEEAAGSSEQVAGLPTRGGQRGRTASE
jgi:hypothetical protein